MAAINQMFSPEFRNRLDATISFGNLPPEVIRQVVHKFIYALEGQLTDRGVAIELTEEAAGWLAEKGYDEKFGARPLARVIQEHIKRPLADELLFGRLEKGGNVRVIVEEKDGVKVLGFEFGEPMDGGTKKLPAPDASKPARAVAKPRKPRAIPGRRAGEQKALAGPSGNEAPPRPRGSSPVPIVPLKRDED